MVNPSRTNYARGAALERQVAGKLTDAGFWVGRVAGSHGVADLIALHASHRPWLVQCKTQRANVGPAEWDALWSQASAIGAIAVLADRSGSRGTPMLYVVMGSRPPRGKVADYVAPIAWEDL